MAKAAKQSKVEEQTAAPQAPAAEGPRSLSLDGATRGKFVMFGIPETDRVEGGPVMRGVIETDAGKINAAAWKKTGRESGADYLSLKVGNTKLRPADASADMPEEWVIGPFYGRLFRELEEVNGKPTVKRYFGFIEDSVKVGDDPKTNKGVYRTTWQIQIKAKPAVSNDQKTRYISGSVHPRATQGEAVEGDLPF